MKTETELQTSITQVIGILLIGTVGTVVVILMGGLELSFLWRWFAVPIFGLPPLTITKAIGVAILVGCFHRGLQRKEPDKEKSPLSRMWSILLTGIFTPLLGIAVGWLVHLMM